MKFLTNMATTGLIAATAIGVATVSTVAPAQAAILAGSTIQLGTPFGANASYTATSLDFEDALGGQNIFVTGGSGSFSFPGSGAGLIARLVATSASAVVQDVSNIPAFAPISSFFTANLFNNPATGLLGGNFGGVITSNAVRFDLNTFTFLNGVGNGTGLLTRGADSIQALFAFSTQGASPNSYSATITAVPTPALLPGLLGLGLTAMRKRSKKAQEVAA